jgi:glycosyltransferase involved in cell wall biosynthesis
MNEPRVLRILLVGAHPVQYASPIFRLLAQDPRVEIQVAYCDLQGADAGVDPGFGVRVKWDVPLLDGYPWIRLPNRSWTPGGGTFFGLLNPGIWRLISKGQFDAVVLFTGYVFATFWIAVAAAKWNGAALIFGTDAHELASRDGKPWKLWLKKQLCPHLFRLADIAMIVSSGGATLMRSLGISENHIALAPFCVDNDWWVAKSDQADRATVRARWAVPQDSVVVLFCAKLQPWKRPQDLLRAFVGLAIPNAYLVFAGDGALRSALESEAQSLGVAGRVRFLGFVNQSGLPETYTASDILVLPSDYEPFGLVVNEAMLCRCPVIVSDRVGARFDLVREGETGYVFPCGDSAALAATLRDALSDRARLRRMGEAARDRMSSWSPSDYANALVEAVSNGIAFHRKPQGSAG